MQYPLSVKAGRTVHVFESVEDLRAKAGMLPNADLRAVWTSLVVDDAEEAFVLWEQNPSWAKSAPAARKLMTAILAEAAKLDAVEIGKTAFFFMADPGKGEDEWPAAWAKLRGEEPPVVERTHEPAEETPQPIPEPTPPVAEMKPKRAPRTKKDKATQPPTIDLMEVPKDGLEATRVYDMKDVTVTLGGVVLPVSGFDTDDDIEMVVDSKDSDVAKRFREIIGGEPISVEAKPPLLSAQDEANVELAGALRDALAAHGVIVEITVGVVDVVVRGEDVGAVARAIGLLGVGDDFVMDGSSATVPRKKARLPQAPTKPKGSARKGAKPKAQTTKVTVASVVDPAPIRAPVEIPPEAPQPRERNTRKVKTGRKLALDEGPTESLGRIQVARGGHAQGEVVTCEDYYGDGHYKRTCPCCDGARQTTGTYADFGPRIMPLKRTPGLYVRAVQPQCRGCRRIASMPAKKRAAAGGTKRRGGRTAKK